MIDKRVLKKVNFIEIYQIFGGVIGLLYTAYLFFTAKHAMPQDLSHYFSMITPFLFFGLCIYSGVLLNMKKYSRGLKLVMVSLILQLLSIQLFGFFYTAINGIAINLSVDLTSDFIVGFDFYISRFLIVLNSSHSNIIIKINLIAIAMLFYTAKVSREIKLNV